jgi:hypothetical protein
MAVEAANDTPSLALKFYSQLLSVSGIVALIMSSMGTVKTDLRIEEA